MRVVRRLFITCLIVSAVTLTALGQEIDQEYSDRIREYTTDARFLNSMVATLPRSESVPSPMDHFGDIIGAPGVLHNTGEIYQYLRRLDEASPRLTIRSIGRTEEGREMLEAIFADEETIANLEAYRAYLNRLSDPRTLDAQQAQEIVRQAKPVYYLTAGLHSPETGSPEMVMELAYRLAVEESPHIQNIRRNVIVIFTIAEPDGRDRIVDLYRYRKANRDVSAGLTYWGHYVAHDNNRDGFGLALALTRNILAAYLHWKPTVMHDLHESVSYLYTSTGTGPYNEYIDPLTIQEWHNLSFEEVTELTKRGMPGVWTHGFYTGWAANYLIWIANNRNSIGRFYETFGNSIPDTVERKLTERQISRQWYRANPPLEKTLWSLRNNTNYMQSGVLVALDYTARNRQRFVENFYEKSRRAIEHGREKTPHAYVIPLDQKRQLAVRDFVNLLQMQGLEVHFTSSELSWGNGPPADEDGNDKEKPQRMEVDGGAYVVRMDQPYRTLARILLDKQNFPSDANPPYDDTGWFLPALHQVTVHTVDDPEILNLELELLRDPVSIQGRVVEAQKPFLLLNNTTDDQVTVFRFRLAEVPMKAAEEAFEADGRQFAAGSLIIEAGEASEEVRRQIETTATELGQTLVGLSSLPEVPTHDLEVPRVALVHTWVSTPQDAGWWRYAFDTIGIPYRYLSEQDLAVEDLSELDVIILPRTRANPQTLVAGTTSAGPPLPWKKSDEYPHLGVIDQTDDVRRGMGYEGLARLKSFLEGGGVLITEGSTSAFPIEMALTRRIDIRQTRNLVARGSVLTATVADPKSPITYGYDETLAVYFSQRPVFRINKNVGNYRVPDWLKDEIWEKEVPRPVLNFAEKDLLISGMLKGASELAGTPAVVDVPVGNGHVVLFANRPFWRWETRGSHALVFNTLLHWNDLRTGWPERSDE